MRIRNHLLLGDAGEPVSFRKSPNQSSPVSPLYLILHYTAGTSLEGAVSWFLNPDAQASAHLVIGRDGAIVQLVPFNRKAWHAGVSSWGRLEGMNRYSIGIELVNAGRLRRRPDGHWADWTGKVVPADEVTVAIHRHEKLEAGWHEYTDVQVRAAVRVASLLRATYRITDVLGHEDVSPGRKTDPGPLFPLNSFRSIVMGRR
jgi:N-acetylmuramoyl-L-alanine amidase